VAFVRERKISVCGEGPLHIFSPPLYFRPAGKLGVLEYDFSSVVIVSFTNEKAMREVVKTEEEKDKLLISFRKRMLLICMCRDERKIAL
jgi:hypothetical protein